MNVARRIFLVPRDFSQITQLNEKKRSNRCKHHCCSKAEPKFPTPPPAADPLPGDVGRPQFNELEMVTTFTYKPSLVMIDAPNLELSW